MGNKTISILFDVQQLYYLPQYLPVYHELLKQDAGDATFVFYHSIHDKTINRIIKSEHLNYVWVKEKNEANQYYKNADLWWIIAQANHIGKGTLVVEPGLQIRIPTEIGDILADLEDINQ